MAHFNKNEGEITPDSLILGGYEARKIKIKAGAGKLARGTVLGEIASGPDAGKFVKSEKTITSGGNTAAVTDGSEVPDRVLMTDVDATGPKDADGIAAITGRFDQKKLILGAGHTLGSIDKPFRLRSIYLENPLG
ncbi:hypothetical protein PMNALOAF_2752 [Methylobacterium adhaesivum]|uniref:Head decoration protein n=1 Tax=Methylobacterium adhaesivum TaxID=333297 RepID=A0ABT8BKA1_9HYPH|nr:head decoration protein [Methylobacterium adhaesivum]MDN3592105.1 head decoration protein [Methylobacterium adhaesivum]GJD31493.1 hypothetical protein PMNALOAF_2752 [Methylobacterium adhaesivum]